MPDPMPAVPKGTSPADRVALAVQRWGEDGFVDRCLQVLTTGSWGEEPEIMDYFADYGAALVDRGLGKEGYWLRVWPLRALLYVWSEAVDPESAVRAALSDEHWRAREMACKVVVHRELGSAAGAAGSLLADEVPRVRAAAARAVGAVGEASTPTGCGNYSMTPIPPSPIGPDAPCSSWRSGWTVASTSSATDRAIATVVVDRISVPGNPFRPEPSYDCRSDTVLDPRLRR